MDVNRLNAKVNIWEELNASQSCENWKFRVKQSLEAANNGDDVIQCINRNSKERIFSYYFESFKLYRINDVNRDVARNGNGGNKLRQYSSFKTEYGVDDYVKCIMPEVMSKFRCEVAPIRVETRPL